MKELKDLKRAVIGLPGLTVFPPAMFSLLMEFVDSENNIRECEKRTQSANLLLTMII